MDADPDHSAAFVLPESDRPGFEGLGLTILIRWVDQLCIAAIEALAPLAIRTSLTNVRAVPWPTPRVSSGWRSTADDEMKQL